MKKILEGILQDFAKNSKVFAKEAQFQFELAWELQKRVGVKYKVFLEYPCGKISYDIVLKSQEDKYIVIELKYKTVASTYTTLDYGKLQLKNHAAQDLGRYDFLKDIERIENWEQFSNGKSFEKGYAIFLTNDMLYLKDSLHINNNVKYKQFCIGDSQITKGKKNWENGMSKTSCGKNRVHPITISKDYDVQWENYNYNVIGQPEFKYLIIEIK